MVLAILRSTSIYNAKRWIVLKTYRFQIMAPILLFFTSLVSSLYFSEFEPRKLLSYLVISSIPLSYAMLSTKMNPIKITSGLVIIHSTVLFCQFGLFYFFNVDFDPVYLLSDVKQGGWGGMQEHDILGRFRRLGGLYSEPGTYANFVAPLVAILILKGHSENTNKVAFLGAISIFFTFSIFGWIYLLVLIALKLFHSKWKSFFIFMVTFGAIVLAMPYLIFRFTGFRSDASTASRLANLDAILQINTESTSNFLLGSGLLTSKIPFELFGAINDVGLLFYLFLTAGFFGVLIVVFTVFDACRRLQMPGMAIGILLLSSKISIFAPMFWMILIITLQSSAENSNSSKLQK